MAGAIYPLDGDAAVAVAPDGKGLALAADALARPGAFEGLAAHEAGASLRLVHPLGHKVGPVLGERFAGSG